MWGKIRGFKRVAAPIGWAGWEERQPKTGGGLKNTYKLGWFSTGRDKAARDLLTVAQRSIALGEIEAEIAFVFCNREP
ncbi:unnamed protein product, partial [marine sediment metagenome]